MSDLISRQAAIDVASFECGEFRGIFGRIEEKLKALPSAQTEIIRCKNCKWWNKDAYSRDDTRFCYEHAHYLPQDYFCAAGERRDNDVER